MTCAQVLSPVDSSRGVELIDESTLTVNTSSEIRGGMHPAAFVDDDQGICKRILGRFSGGAIGVCSQVPSIQAKFADSDSYQHHI